MSLVRSLFNVSPAAENNLSDGTDVPGMHSYGLANLAIILCLLSTSGDGVYIQRSRVVTMEVFYLHFSTVGCILNVLVPKEYRHGCSAGLLSSALVAMVL